MFIIEVGIMAKETFDHTFFTFKDDETQQYF